MRTLQEEFKSYSEFHKSLGNKITHMAGIPMIVFSTFGLLSLVGSQWFNAGLVVWFLSSAFYLKLDLKTAAPFCVLTLLICLASSFVPTYTHIFLFVLGWILQGVGHYVYEKKSPAFLTNLNHLLIGPLWIYCYLVRRTPNSY